MPIAEADSLAATRATALTEHYQRTVDLVSRAWVRRNRQFIILIAVLAAAVLVAFSRQLIAPLLEALIVDQLPKLPDPAAGRLRAFLPARQRPSPGAAGGRDLLSDGEPVPRLGHDHQQLRLSWDAGAGGARRSQARQGPDRLHTRGAVLRGHRPQADPADRLSLQDGAGSAARGLLRPAHLLRPPEARACRPRFLAGRRPSGGTVGSSAISC